MEIRFISPEISQKLLIYITLTSGKINMKRNDEKQNFDEEVKILKYLKDKIWKN